MAINKKPIPQRIYNASKEHPYVAGAVDIIDDIKGKNQQQINAEASDAILAEKNRAEAVEALHQSEINALDSQNYVTVTADDQTTTAIDVLPPEGEVDTIYRVGNWDGEQYDDSCYSEYAWNGTQYIFMDKKQYGIDDRPTDESNNLSKSGGISAGLNTQWLNFGEYEKSFATPSYWEVISRGIYLRAGRTYKFTGIAENPITEGQFSIIINPNNVEDREDALVSMVLNSAYQSREYNVTPSVTGEYKISARNMDGASGNVTIQIVADYIPTKTRDDLNPLIPTAYQVLDSKLLVLDYRSVVFEGIGIDASTGGEVSSSVNDCTDFIPVECGNSIVTISCITTATAKNGIAFYDEDKNFIVGSGYYRTEGPSMSSEVELLVPENACYVRVSVRRSDLSGFWFKTTYSQYYPGKSTRTEEKVDNIYKKGIDFLDIDSPFAINIDAVQMTGETVWFRSSMIRVRKGMTVKYNILSRNNVAIIKLYSNNSYDEALVVDAIYSKGQQQIYSGSYVVPQDGYIIVFHLIDEDNNIEQNAILCNFATKVLSDTVSKGIADKQTNSPIDSFRINMGENNSNVKVLISNRDAEATKFDNYYMENASIVTAGKNMFYLYYEGSGRENRADYRTSSGVCLMFAYSTDGEHFTRGFPSGIQAPQLDTYMNPYSEGGTTRYREVNYDGYNVIMGCKNITYNGYHDVVRRSAGGMDITKVQDPVYPFRMIGNVTIDGVRDGLLTESRAKIVTTMYMWKSADGVNWIEVGEVSESWYDSQYSVIAKGDVLKIYCRLRYKESNGNKNDYIRTIGVMYTDLDGNIITPANTLFGESLYCSGAFKIDDKRELLIPTWYGGQDEYDVDINDYKAYIVDQNNSVFETSLSEVAKLKLPGDIWGTANPGFILLDGDQYITYLQTDASYHSDVDQDWINRKLEVRRVPIVFSFAGIRLNELETPKYQALNTLNGVGKYVFNLYKYDSQQDQYILYGSAEVALSQGEESTTVTFWFEDGDRVELDFSVYSYLYTLTSIVVNDEDVTVDVENNKYIIDNAAGTKRISVTLANI